ncbi:MAG: choice-of-anchor J domain-containing protein, partial [Bacteroidales bacterium]|nr:choice-of-anchor J domain-containing protein [Bacteroidales bacterium]
MKRFSLIIALLALVVLSGRSLAQTWYFYESFDNVAVDATGSGYVPDGFTLYNDDNTPFDGKPDLSHFDVAWKVIRGMSGEGYVSAPSLFKDASAKADRWLVTPAISLKGASAPKLYFRAKAGDDQMRDGLVLKISTTTTEQSAFKNIRSVREVPGQWTDYIFDLNEYAGQTVYLAFVQNSSGMLTLDIDDIRIGEAANGMVAVCNNAYAPLYMIHTHEGSNMAFPVTATLQNWSNTPISSVRLCVRMNDGPVIAKIFNQLKIGAATATSLPHQEVSFNFVPQEADKDAVLEIWFDQINGQSVSMEHNKVNCFVVDESDMISKKVIFEIFSSATCSNCGPWNKVFHTWDSILGGNDVNRPEGFVAAKFQVNIPSSGDPLVTSETLARSNYYSVQSAPYWTMNGLRFNLKGGETGVGQTYQSIVDSLAKFKRTVSPIALQARLNIADTTTLMAEIKTTAKLPIIGNYRLYVALIEDSIHEKKQMSEESDFYNIVRKMLPDANGTPLITPQPTDENIESTYAFTYTCLIYPSPSPRDAHETRMP